MKTCETVPFLTHFGSVRDPRVQRAKRYSLPDILFLCVSAVLCGADDCVAIATFGRLRLPWLASFTSFGDDLPSHDTISRVLSLLDPQELERAFVAWVAAIQSKTDGQIVAVDGKTMRRTFDAATGRRAVHMVSAWGSANGLVLGQVKTDDKSNEITAIPKLLQMLDIAGCTVTIDAMGTQKEIARQIVEQEADYVLPVKDNHPNLRADIEAFFGRARKSRWRDARDAPIRHSTHRMFDADHGRSETRVCTCSEFLGEIVDAQDWTGIRSVAMIETERTANAETSTERRFYISSLPPDAERINRAVRTHWGVENSLHWVLDVALNEDRCRSRKDDGAHTRAVLNRVAVNLCRADDTTKVGVKNKRNMAAWDERYLTKLIFGKTY